MCTNNMDLVKEYPVYTVFILFLIIASNYLGELFPCRVQDLLGQNIYLKHGIAFLTMVFFVVLSDTKTELSFRDLVIQSCKMYIVFLILINCSKTFFMIALVLLAGIYVIQLKKNDFINTHDPSPETQIQIERINQLNNILLILFFIVIISGFIIYMGEKKIEYRNDFSYTTFLFGKPSCRGISPPTKYTEALKAAFQ